VVTKRTPIKRNTKMRITPQMLDVYAVVNQLYDEERHADEFHEAELLLDQLLGRQPWQESITDTFDQDAPPDWMYEQGQARINDWQEANAIREQLDAALIERGWPHAKTKTK
jgi:hypothetical protein